MTLMSTLTYIIIIFIFAITPGPGVFAILARALAFGSKKCISLALGMAISDVIYLVFAYYGLAIIAEQWSELFTIIRFAGAFYLIYLGWKMWNTPLGISREGAKLSTTTKAGGVFQGFLISASNPKVILFYLAFLPTIMNLNDLSISSLIMVSTITLIGIMSGLMLIALCGSLARRFFESKSAVKKLNRTASGVMIGAGAYLGLSG